MECHRKCLAMRPKDLRPDDWAGSQLNLGHALSALGELEQDTDLCWAAMEAYKAALSVHTATKAPESWAGINTSIAICYRSLARISGDHRLFDQAEVAYEAALEIQKPEIASYDWANTIGGLGELALDRFAFDPDPKLLNEAEERLRQAKLVMSKSNEVLDDRISDLLAKIAQARTASGLP